MKRIVLLIAGLSVALLACPIPPVANAAGGNSSRTHLINSMLLGQSPPNPYLRRIVNLDAGNQADAGPVAVGSPANNGNPGIWSPVDGGAAGSPANNGNSGVYK